MEKYCTVPVRRADARRAVFEQPLNPSQPVSRNNPVLGNVVLRYIRRQACLAGGRKGMLPVLAKHKAQQYGDLTPAEMDYLVHLGDEPVFAPDLVPSPPPYAEYEDGSEYSIECGTECEDALYNRWPDE